jgi:TusA-related sulfurtransferase
VLQVSSLIPKELNSYSTLLVCGTLGVLSVVALYGPDKLLEVFRRSLVPSNLTVENLKVLPEKSPINLSYFEDQEETMRIKNTCHKILNLKDSLVRGVVNTLDETYALDDFVHLKENGIWNQQLKITVKKDQFFFCYAVALLHFVYKHNNYLKQFDLSYFTGSTLRNPAITVLKDAIRAKSNEELMVILEKPYCMNFVVQWVKSFADPNVTYDFSSKSLPHIKALFERFGLYVNIAKEEEDYYFITGISEDKKLLKDIFVSPEAQAEFVLSEENENSITYHSDS